MKILIVATLIFFVYCQVGFGGEALTGIDIYCVVGDEDVNSTQFVFQNILSHETIKGSRSLTTLLNKNDVSNVTIENVERSGIPVDVINFTFKPNIKIKLIDALKESSEVVIVFCGEPRATLKIKEILNSIQFDSTISLIYPIKNKREYLELKSTIRTILNGTWHRNFNSK